MNISNWPIGRIMQLPDCCFGQKWLVTAEGYSANGARAWDMSELAYPDRMVLWEVNLCWVFSDDWGQRARIAMADVLPRTAGMMSANVPLLQGIGIQGPEPRFIYSNIYGGNEKISLRKYMEPQGKRLVIEAYSTAEHYLRIRVHTVVSSMPNEVPEWLISGQGSVP